jgi:glycosyltransferase involved in cell wall biosynthesis
MDLSIIIPAYNESARIRSTLEEVIAFAERELKEWEIIVVDDGSVDDTQALVRGLSRVKYLRNEKNSGKGWSVRRGIFASRLDPVLFSDADLSTPIVEALSLMKAMEEGADMAIASRQSGSGKRVLRSAFRKWRSAIFRVLVKMIALRGTHDTQCGFKMFRRAAARSIFSLQRLDRFGFDVEVLYLARKLSLKVAEVPVEWHEGTKTSLKLATPLSMLADLFKIRWNDWRGRYG